MGLNVRLPHSFNHISERISSNIRDLNPAVVKVAARPSSLSVIDPSNSPTGNLLPSICLMISIVRRKL